MKSCSHAVLKLTNQWTELPLRSTMALYSDIKDSTTYYASYYLSDGSVTNYTNLVY